jgi:hypothetical protein
MLQAINAGSDCFAKAASSIRSLPLAVLQFFWSAIEKARRALPFAAGFPFVAYLRYYRGDRNYFIESMLEARPRSPLRLRAPNVSAAARLPIL